MKKVELLAPVGSLESLYAAINAGCDAVYLSGYMFGARQFAPNFSDEEIVGAIKLCHIYGVKVYITVNTLIKESEVDNFIQYIDFLHQNNVDAVIMQDLGMIDLVRKTFPKLEIHASTQLHIHNLEGVKFCEKLGIKRVVLARETNIDLVKEIKDKTNIDIELFVHGALCVSYSGQCLMSSLIGGRSGNRGACAGTCRLPYKLLNESGKQLNQEDYVLSMKDLCTLDHIPELINSGIESLKIEGRMKRPEYVYLVVSLYRKAIDSYYECGKVLIDDEYLKELKKIFNRQFTKGFLFHEENNNITNSYRPNHLGVELGKIIDVTNKTITLRLSDDVNLGDGIRIINGDLGFVITNMSKNRIKVESARSGDVVTIMLPEKFNNNSIRKDGLVVKTTDVKQIKDLKCKISGIDKKISINGSINLKIGEPITLTLTDGINNVCVKGEIIEKSKTAPLSYEHIEKQISKMGATPFALENLEITKDDNIYINNKFINEIRRTAVEQLINLREYKTGYERNQYSIKVPDFKNIQEINVLLEDSRFYLQVKDTDVDHIYTTDLSLFDEKDNRLIFKVPRVIYQFNKYNIPLMIGEVGSLNLNNKLIGDFSLNVFNSYTVAFLHSIGLQKVTLSYELELDQIKAIIDAYNARYSKSPNLELIVYGREEMMISKFSLNKLYKTNELYLRDRFNNKYPVRQRDGLMYIYNYTSRKPSLKLEDYFKLGINSIRINIFDKQDLEWFLLKFEN